MSGPLDELNTRTDALLAEVERAIVGKRQTLELVLAALLADGHVIIEDFPGLAKTLIARSFAKAIGVSFKRVQFTPDLMPSEVTGAMVFDQSRRELVFRPGPLFANLVLGDEINRAPPKTQAAMLEAMAERQVTVDGRSWALDPPFLVIATQNPIEYEGTYPLPEAQLDRFLVRVRAGYPEAEDEEQILDRRLQRASEQIVIDTVVTGAEFLEMQRSLEGVHVAPALRRYIVAIVGATRSHPAVELGSSPRGSLAVLTLGRAWAAMHGREFMTPEDVKAVAGPALAHRLSLTPEQWVRGTKSDDVVAECLSRVPVPSPEEVAQRG